MKSPLFIALATSLLVGAELLAGQAPAAAQPPPAAPQRPPPQRASTPPPAAGPGEIRGSVVDAANNAPVGSASVAVWSKADSALVAGAIARPDGSFRIQGLRPGTYYLRVSMMGFEVARTGELSLTAEAPRASAGSVKLTRAVVALEGLTVTTQRSLVAVAPDRNSYRARDVAPAATTATDVLESVPSVEVDADGKLSLRGNENVVVQINGRPSPIRGAQLAGYLKGLPANTIERVEVVPNPSAKQDPEGMAGIINIVLKQNVDLGMSAGLTLAASTAQRYSASGNFGYQSGPFSLLLSYGYTDDTREVLGINNRTRLGGMGAPLSFTEQDIGGSVGNSGHNLNATLDYRLTPRDVLSGALLLNRRTARDASLSAYRELTGSGTLRDRYDRTRDTETDNLIFDYTLAFKRTLVPQKHELAAELRLNRTDDGDRTDLWRLPLGSAGSGTPVDLETNDLDALTSGFTAQLDYTRMLAERTKLETGYKGNARWLDRDFRVRNDSLGSGSWVYNAMLSNALEFDERVNAVYGVLSHGIRRVELQAGLRAEHASRDFALANADERYPHDYVSLFPSGLVSYKPSDRDQLKLSYSRRIRRPGTQELNPFPAFFDPQNVFLGNPRLSPEYTDAVELGYTRSGQLGSLQLSPFYRRTTDIIRVVINTADTVSGREVTSVSFKNLDTGTSWGTDLNGTLRIGPVFNGLAGVNLFKMVTDGTSGESSIGSDAVTWSARVNGTLNLSAKTALQGSYFYRAPMAIERGRFSAMQMTNFSVRHRLYGERGSVTLRVSDPFNTMRFRVEAGDDNIVQLTERRFNSRALHLSFQYNYGQAPRIRQRPQQPQPEPQAGFPAQ